MIPYLLHSSILLAGCFVFYWLFIRHETFFKLNRWVLVCGILLSVSIPLIQVPEAWSLRTISPQAEITSPGTLQEIAVPETVIQKPKEKAVSSSLIADPAAPDIEIEEEVNVPNDEARPSEALSPVVGKSTSLPFGKILWYIYLTGVLVFFLAFLIQLFILLTKMYTFISFKDGKYRIVELVKDEAPYSFWNSIFINPGKYDLETYTQIIDHEKIHIQQAHFIDKLIAEFLLIAFWFNPFVWLLRKAITNNLEYLTDSSMIAKGTEKQSYQLSLLKVSVPQHPLNLTTSYNNSFLKSRIAMMNSKKSSASSSWKYLFLIPLLAFSMLCLNEVQSKKAELLLSESEISQPESQQTEPETETEAEETAEVEMLEDVETETEQPDQQDEPDHEIFNLVQDNNGNTKVIMSDHLIIIEGGNEMIKAGFENSAWSTETRPGHWTAEIDGDRVCFELNNSRPAKQWTWITHECFKKSELSSIPMEKDADFFIKRAAGTLKLHGSFTGDFGDGTFNFEEDASFRSYLATQGMEILKDEHMFHLFLNNVNKDYVAYLKKQGFKADGKDLVELSIHGINRERIDDFVEIFKKLDYKGYKVRDLIQFEIHDVEPEYVNEMRAQGLTDLTVNEVVQAKIHDVEPEFIKAVMDYGFKDIDLNEIIQFAIHDVDVDYIREMKNLGFRKLSHNEIVQSAIHDVDAGYIREIHNAGFADMKMSELVQFAIHDVDADYIREIHDAGFTDMKTHELVQFAIHDIDADYIKGFTSAGLTNISSSEIIQAGIHDVDIDFIKEMKAYGMDDLKMHQIIQLSIHDVDADYLKEMKAAGYSDLDYAQIAQARIHDVDPDYIQELKAQGLSDLKMEEIVQFSIHDIKVRDIKAFREAGLDVDNHEIIQAGIHDVSAKYVKQMIEMGFKDADIQDFIQAKIHDISPNFIRKAREKGHNSNDLQDYIRWKIQGI